MQFQSCNLAFGQKYVKTNGMNCFYLTTPIYYVNDKPHVGHAYTSLAGDVLARFHRLLGQEVFFLSGTDEHGQKVEKAAAKQSMLPQVFTDKVSQNFRDLVKLMDFSIDDFIRTTEARHKIACQFLWDQLLANGYIYKGKYSGYYALRDEAYYQINELIETAEGKKIAPTGAEVEWVEEESYFFKLSQFQKPLLQYYQDHPEFIKPVIRRHEVISFVEQGLKDLSISRTNFSWGIAVPNDDSHIMYVWVDALTNYLTALGYPNVDNKRFQKFWPCDLHLVGKDIIRFHAIYWPAILMAVGLPLPKQIFAHGWWTNNGEKISKSLGNIIDPLQLINDYGLDATRYFLLRQVPFGEDGDFSETAILNRKNHDLANDLGNLALRSLSLVERHLNSQKPIWLSHDDLEEKMVAPISAEVKVLAHELLNIAGKNLLNAITKDLNELAFHKALEKIWQVVRKANQFIDKAAPWNLTKLTNDEGISKSLVEKSEQKLEKEKAQFALQQILAVLLLLLQDVGILLQPFMPESSRQLLQQLGLADKDMVFANIGRAIITDRPLPKPKALFPKDFIKKSS